MYTVDKARDLLVALQSEAPLMMLFLKSISKIKVYHWMDGELGPELVFSCAVGNESAALMQERSLFTRVSATCLEAAAAAASQGTEASASTQASIINARQGCRSIFSLDLTITDCVSDTSRDRRFLVSQVAAGGAAYDLAVQLSKQLSAPMVPWGAVAADITLNEDAGEHGEGQGKAFCFLPLPSPTGLPCHINGFFELSSNRRDIWHGSDLAGAGAQRANWNLVLLEQAIAPAYAAMIEEARVLIGPGAAYDRQGGDLFVQTVGELTACCLLKSLLTISSQAVACPRCGTSLAGARSAIVQSGFGPSSSLDRRGSAFYRFGALVASNDVPSAG